LLHVFTLADLLNGKWKKSLVGMANVVPSSPILVPLMMEELSSSETSVITRATWRNIPEDAVIKVVMHFPQSP
jgi:hypothetical protein